MFGVALLLGEAAAAAGLLEAGADGLLELAGAAMLDAEGLFAGAAPGKPGRPSCGVVFGLSVGGPIIWLPEAVPLFMIGVRVLPCMQAPGTPAMLPSPIPGGVPAGVPYFSHQKCC